MRSMLAAACALTLLGPPVSAQLVQSFDGTRCYSGTVEYWLTGSGMVGPHAQLLSGGYAVATTGAITPTSLASASVFVTGILHVGATLSASEATALQAWVAAGGGLLYMGESDHMAALNNQIGSLFGAASYAGAFDFWGYSVTITAPQHPVITGSGGTVTTLSGLNVGGRWGGVAPHVTVVATNPDSTPAVLAFQHGLGRVVMLNEAVYFSFPPSYTSQHALFFDNVIEWLAGGACGAPMAFCTSSTTSSGCVPAMSASGVASVAASSGFTLTCSSVEGQRAGLIFYGVNGPYPQSWAPGSTSYLCIRPPLQRTPAQTSGGTPQACDGALSVDFLAFLAANTSALGQPVSAGQVLHAQAWFRDPPAPKTTNLSNGMRWIMCP